MPEYLSPGVYVEEVETGAAAIEGVSTSTAGFLGEAERGPVESTFVGSFAEFKRHFGGFDKYRRNEPLEGTNLAYAVNGFFRNGGSRCYVGRVTSATELGDHRLGAYGPALALVADEDEVGFGSVVTGQTVTETVEISHSGIENDPDIEIQSISIAGPDAIQFDRVMSDETTTPRTILPGEPIVVEVIYRPQNDTTHSGSLRVEHDGDDSPLEVPLLGTGITPTNAAELSVTPSVLDFGTVPTDTSVPQSLTVSNDGLEGADPVTITSLSKDGSNPDEFTIENADEFNPTDLEVGDDPRSIDISVEHDTAEEISAILEINVAGQPDPFEVQMRALVVDPANTLGASVVETVFDSTVTGTIAETTVVLRNMGGPDDNDLTIQSVDPSPPSTFSGSLVSGTTPMTLEPGETTPLRITFAPTSAGTPSDTIDVTYDDGTGTPTRQIRVEGTAENVDGEYTPTPPPAEDITYGDVVVGESETQTITMANTARAGGGNVTIQSVELTNDDEDEYSLPDELIPDDPTQPVAVLEPGQSRAVPVTVTPSGNGLVEAQLEITFANGTSGTHTYDLIANGVDATLNIEAVGPGEWGGRVAVTVRNSARTNETFDVTVRYWSSLDEGEEGDTDAELVRLQDDPDVEEVYTELSTNESSSNYYETVINSGSTLVEVERIGTERPENGTNFLDVPPDEEADDPVGLTHFRGDESAPRGERTGLAGFAETDDISIVTVPDENDVDGLTGEIVSHCENMQDRFAVLQAPQGANPGDLPSNTAISEYAALYYPHIKIVDPDTGVRKLVPPGGHMTGIYARSDAEEGVWKAPANETVRGAVELEFPITKADQDRLNPKGVNAIRSFSDRGIRVWGARTTSVNPQWKYVNVRRLFLYIEESIDEGTQWAVFESNTEKLWARVRQSVRNFLTTVWRNGGLAGTTPEEAFFVKADRTTMTQTDIDNGKLIVEVGVAPVKPAEFVIFRITQWTEGLEGGS